MTKSVHAARTIFTVRNSFPDLRLKTIGVEQLQVVIQKRFAGNAILRTVSRAVLGRVCKLSVVEEVV
jgi:hypothetical protein